MSAAGLGTYAQMTARDCNCTLEQAIRCMRDEPGEVALALEISRDEVIAWCREALSDLPGGNTQ